MRNMATALLSLSLLSASPAVADSLATPESVIRSATDSAVERLEANPDLARDPGRLFAMVHDVVLPHFDFNRIARRVLGKYWRRASDDQKRQFISEFQTLLVKTYAVAIASYNYEGIAYRSPKSRSETEISVPTEITGNGSPGIPITYELHLVDGSWKVYDIVVDGVSLSLTYRNDFRSLVRQRGIDALIERLVAHNHEAQ
jgi:phospholipid transport system substrate-binding protein